MIFALLTGCVADIILLGEKPDVTENTSSLTTSDTAAPDTAGDTATDTSEPPPVRVPDWTVDCNGGADFRTIQSAIEGAVSGDDIAVAPCEYHERIDFIGKNLSIWSTEGSASTIIDADYGGTVVNIENGEGDQNRLAGFTIEDGTDTDFGSGSGLEVSYANIQLEDIVFDGNGAGWSVIFANQAFVDMVDVVVRNSPAAPDGAAIYSDGGGLSATGLEIDCDGGLAAVWQHNATQITDSHLRCVGGYGVYGYHSELNLRRNTVVGSIAGVYAEDEDDNPSEQILIWNSAITGGTAVDFRYVHFEVVNSVLWGLDVGINVLANDTASSVNSSIILDSPCGVNGESGSVSTRYTNFWNNDADTCGGVTVRATYAEDPLFVAFPDDLHLGKGSGMIDAGDPALDDADGSRNDVGVYGGPEGSGW